MKKSCLLLVLLNMICLALLLFKNGQDVEVASQSAGNETAVSEKSCEKQEENEPHPRIAITFDDGPNAEWTPVLLEGLKERGVKASFFVIGEKAEEQPEIIERMFKEGHIIGNHTFTHVQLTGINDSSACEEITKTNEVLKEITGTYPLYIRPPFGSWNDKLECGIKMFPVMWTIDTLDWTTSNADKVVNKAVSQAKDNAIILLHDNYKSSVQAALRIIDELQKKGYEFVTVEELLLD